MGNKPIVHAPIATGSTEPRDIRDRFADFVNLKDFGAAGDGVTDDSTAWAAWQTALESGGMPYIPAGDYLLDDEIVHAPKGHFGVNKNIFSYEDDGVVLDEFGASVYVDASVSSSGDGYTAATAVKTINEGIAILQSLPLSSEIKTRLYIAGGTYNETSTVRIQNLHIAIELQGLVTINNTFYITRHSHVHISASSNGSLVVNVPGTTAFAVGEFSYVTIDCPISVTSSNTDISITIYYNAVCFFQSSLTVTCTNVTGAMRIGASSWASFDGDLTISGTCTNGIAVYDFAVCTFKSNVTISCSNTAILSENFSSIFINGSNSPEMKLTGTKCIQANNHSSVQTHMYAKLTCTCLNGGAVFVCTRHAFIDISSMNTVDITLSNQHSGNVFNIYEHARIAIGYNISKIKIVGSCWAVAFLNEQAILVIDSAVSFEGSNIQQGLKFQCWVQSFIDTKNSGGVNRLPGSGYELDTSRFSCVV